VSHYLSPAHAELLRRSAIDPDVAEERGYRTVEEKVVLERYGFAGYQRRVPALLIPLHDVHGREAGWQSRPDHPRARGEKAIKYETPAGSALALDCPPRCRAGLADPSRRLWITEGVRKVDALASCGEVALGLSGVYGWRGRNEFGGLTRLPEWEEVALNGREVALVFDSDARTNQNVQTALARLARWLEAKGARVTILLPPASDDHKVGVDDFLAAGGSLDGLERFEPQSIARDDGRRPVTATDEGMAELFVRRFADKFRYLVERGEWGHCEDGIWHFPREHYALEAAMNVLRDVPLVAHALPSGPEREALLRFSIRCLDSRHRDGLLQVARHRPELEVALAELDRHPLLLACANGTLNLETGELRPHDPADLLTRSSPVAYDPHARSAVFEQFLADVFRDDDELIRYVQRLFGYCLTGITHEQQCWVLTGVGANGKSVLNALARAILGGLYTPADFSTFERRREASETRPDLVRLAGHRLVVASEREKVRPLGEATIKQITGGDEIVARGLYAKPIRFTPTFKLWLICNDPPKINSTDYAIRRRLAVVPFLRTFWKPGDPVAEPEEYLPRDPMIEEKLLAELPVVLAWAVRGALEWRADGLGSCRAVEQATSEYMERMNPLADFAEECPLFAGDAIVGGELRDAYNEWCEQPGRRRLSNADFGAAMRGLGFEKRKGREVSIWTRVVEVDKKRESPLRERSIETLGNVVHVVHDDAFRGPILTDEERAERAAQASAEYAASKRAGADAAPREPTGSPLAGELRGAGRFVRDLARRGLDVEEIVAASGLPRAGVERIVAEYQEAA
jgi:putative DNA primase/helicase